MTIAFILVAAAAAAQPSLEAMELARQVAAHGALAQIAPVQTQNEVEGMIEDHPEFSDAERGRLRAIGKEQAKALIAKAVDAEAASLAAQLTIEDLRALAAFASSPAAEHQRAALPKIIAATMTTLGKVDYAGGVRAAFCAETRKLCDRK
jgi:hypothetical protein